MKIALSVLIILALESQTIMSINPAVDVAQDKFSQNDSKEDGTWWPDFQIVWVPKYGRKPAPPTIPPSSLLYNMQWGQLARQDQELGNLSPAQRLYSRAYSREARLFWPPGLWIPLPIKSTTPSNVVPLPSPVP